jgi:hypothetical protein
MNVFNISGANTSINGGGQGFGGHGPGGANGNGLGDIVSKYLDHAMKDGHLSKSETKTLEKLVKAEQQSQGCDNNKCGDKQDQDCGDSKGCDKADKANDRLIQKYLDSAMKDGHLNRMEKQVLEALVDRGGGSSFA